MPLPSITRTLISQRLKPWNALKSLCSSHNHTLLADNAGHFVNASKNDQRIGIKNGCRIKKRRMDDISDKRPVGRTICLHAMSTDISSPLFTEMLEAVFETPARIAIIYKLC
uniref:DDE_3 domain-containing protein n=1 Tax=Panagrellus redivivus TaxID=6233 RepID=A0A7E5A0A0_PANRE